MSTEKKRFILYLVIAFLTAWAAQLASMFGGAGIRSLLSVSMLFPMLAVLIVFKGLRREKTGIGWKLNLRGNGKAYLCAWFLPAGLTVVGAALYFALFPGQFDLSMSYLTAATGAEGSAPPLDPVMLTIVEAASALTFAPILNGLFAVGEEAGWRGYMTPYLMRRFGRNCGLILSGVIWAVWHAPLIVFSGYEYGVGYFGFPWTGILVMCVFTTAFGTLCTILYEKTGSIWASAILHGAANAIAGLPLMFYGTERSGYLLGPTMAGLIAGIPMLVTAIVALRRSEKKAADTSNPAEAD